MDKSVLLFRKYYTSKSHLPELLSQHDEMLDIIRTLQVVLMKHDYVKFSVRSFLIMGVVD